MIRASNESGDLRGVVAIGASAGGVEALSNLAGGLSPELPYAYLMVLHMPAGAPSILSRIIDRKGPLPAVTAEHGGELQPGHIYVARPNHHSPTAWCFRRGRPRTGTGPRSTRCSVRWH